MSSLLSTTSSSSFLLRGGVLVAVLALTLIGLVPVLTYAAEDGAISNAANGPAEFEEHAPLTEEDLAVRVILEDAKTRVAELERAFAEADDPSVSQKLTEQIAAIKHQSEIRVLETYLDFAERAGESARVSEILKRLAELQRPQQKPEPGQTVRPSSEFPNRPRLIGEEAGQ